MPQIKPLSEFNRNQNALIEDLSHSGEPLYLTRNGSACVVVMDSAAFDAAMAFRNEIYEQEMRTYRGMLKGRRASFTTPRTSWTSCGHSGAGSDGRRRHARSLHGLCAHVHPGERFQ